MPEVSPLLWRVGFRVGLFEACSMFTSRCGPRAHSPSSRAFLEVLQRICRLLHRSQWFQRELGRRAGLSTAEKVRIGKERTATTARTDSCCECPPRLARIQRRPAGLAYPPLRPFPTRRRSLTYHARAAPTPTPNRTGKQWLWSQDTEESAARSTNTA